MSTINQYLRFTLVLGATCASVQVIAEDGAIREAEPLVVTGQKTDGYQTTKSSGLKLDVPLIDTPQSVSVLNKEQIQDQALQDIADVTRYTPGVSISQGEGHRDAISIRGQRTTGDFFLDGLRDDAQYFRPLYNLERIEVHKGPNALVFGRGSGAGNINRVTKTPVLDTRFANINSGVDTFGGYQVALDGNSYVGKNSAVRVNILAEGFENHRDFFDGERYAFNPTFTSNLTDNTTLQLSYEYIDDDRVVDRGVPSFEGGTRANPAGPVSGFRDTFFGSPDVNRTTLQAHILRGRLSHDFNDSHSVNATLLYADYNKLYANLFPSDSLDLVANQVQLDGYIDTTQRNNFIAQVNFLSDVTTGPLQHKLLYGVEYGIQDTQNDRRDNVFQDGGLDTLSFAFSDPLNIPSFSFPELNRDRDSEVSFTSVYLQDQITINKYFQLIAGVRFDQFDFDVFVNDLDSDTGLPVGLDLGRVDEEYSPRVGGIFKPVDNVSIYASYSESFLPRSGEQFLTLTPSNAALAPEVFENIEFGVKWDITSALSFTSSIFRLDRDSGTTVSSTDPGSTILISSRTEGVELQLVGQVTPQWQINAGYSYLDGREDGRIVNGVTDNRTLREVPENLFSIWNRYDFLNGLGLGLGVIHQSEQFANIDNAVELPDFTRVDLAAFYTINDNIHLQLNVENLFDEEYFPASHTNNNITTGEPLNARFGVSVNF